jgi:CDP-diacylglycerol--glycerol-3-phosphate 3-phosphatidyltransferase
MNRALIRLPISDKPTMGIMLQRSLRDPVAKIISPIVRLLVKMGVSANTISTIGGLGSIASALYFFPKGDFFIGVIFVTLFVLSDLFDGAVARASNKGESKWGALLDSTLDRFSDAAIFIGALLFYIESSDPLVVVLLVAVSASFMVSYIKARAESLSIACNGGVAERSERLIIVLVAYGFHGLGVDYVMAIGLWTVALLSLFTVYQRMMIVYKAVN